MKTPPPIHPTPPNAPNPLAHTNLPTRSSPPASPMPSTRPSPPTCQTCASFQNDPTLIESTYPGLTAMSSGFASVRDRDGFCNHHQLYLSARDSCPHFSPRTPF